MQTKRRGEESQREKKTRKFRKERFVKEGQKENGSE